MVAFRRTINRIAKLRSISSQDRSIVGCYEIRPWCVLSSDNFSRDPRFVCMVENSYSLTTEVLAVQLAVSVYRDNVS